MLHRLLLDAARHHHVVHDLALVRHRVRAHHGARPPVALRRDAGEPAARVDEEDGDAEAALEDVELGGGDDLDRLLRGREAAPRLLLAVLQRAPPLGVVVVVVVLLALRQLAAVLRVLRHLAGDGAHLGGGEAAAERQADRARLVGALAVVAHQPLRERAARVGARVAGAALARVVGDEGLGGRAVGHLALRVDALHHVRQHEEVLRLRLRGVEGGEGVSGQRRDGGGEGGGRGRERRDEGGGAARLRRFGAAEHPAAHHPLRHPHAVRAHHAGDPRARHAGEQAAEHRAGHPAAAHHAAAHPHLLRHPAVDAALLRALRHQRLELHLGARAVRDHALLAGDDGAVLGVDVGERLELLADGAVGGGALEEVGVDLLHLVAVRHLMRGGGRRRPSEAWWWW